MLYFHVHVAFDVVMFLMSQVFLWNLLAAGGWAGVELFAVRSPARPGSWPADWLWADPHSKSGGG